MADRDFSRTGAWQAIDFGVVLAGGNWEAGVKGCGAGTWDWDGIGGGRNGRYSRDAKQRSGVDPGVARDEYLALLFSMGKEEAQARCVDGTGDRGTLACTGR